MVPKKIIAVDGQIDFSHPFFRKISLHDKLEYVKAVNFGISKPVTFLDENGNTVFIALYDLHDFYKDGLHVRLLLGNFMRFAVFVNLYFCGLAKFYEKTRVSYRTTRRVMRNFAEKFNCKLNQFGDYEKRVA